jgi:hypothetical protein
MGEYETSQKFSKRAISFWEHSGLGSSSWYKWNEISMALAKVMNNEKDINLNEIIKWHEDIKVKWVKGLTQNHIGKMLLNIEGQHLSKAEDWIKSAIESNKKYGMMWNLAQGYSLYAELFKRKGDVSHAKDELNTAIGIFKEFGADGWVEKYEKELAVLS